MPTPRSAPKSPKSPKSKEEIYWRVLNAVVALDVQAGHQRWKITDLARKSGVSRTLIYYYFGKSKEGLLLEACRLLGDQIAGVTPEKMANWKRGEIATSFVQSRQLISRCPGIVPFYLLNRAKPTATGEALRKSERDFRSKIRTFFPDLTDPQLDAAFALFFGVTFCPEGSGESVRIAIDWTAAALRFPTRR